MKIAQITGVPRSTASDIWRHATHNAIRERVRKATQSLVEEICGHVSERMPEEERPAMTLEERPAMTLEERPAMTPEERPAMTSEERPTMTREVRAARDKLHKRQLRRER